MLGGLIAFISGKPRRPQAMYVTLVDTQQERPSFPFFTGNEYELLRTYPSSKVFSVLYSLFLSLSLSVYSM